MHADLRPRALSIDPKILGSRLKRARQRAGLTQGQTAEGCSSTAYISRIEAGQRRPAPELLDTLAGRLGCTLDDLLAPDPDEAPVVDTAAVSELRLKLDYAELSLRTGDAATARSGAEAIIGRATEVGPGAAPIRREAMLVLAQARFGCGDVGEAIMTLEDLAIDSTRDLLWVRALTLLSGYLHDSGDLARAVEVGEQARLSLHALGLGGTTEAVELALTVAGAHCDRGDVAQAARICARAVDEAERQDSLNARVSAYWNSSIVECEAGRMDTALPLAHRALALLETMEDATGVARLRSELGVIQLDMESPDVEAALENLERSEKEFEWARTSPVDLASNRIAQARAHWMRYDLDRAEEIALSCRDAVSDVAPLVATKATVLLGQVAGTRGDTEAMRRHFRDAILTLSGAGSDRGVAELWFELGALLEEQGMVSEAMAAFRSAAASTGLRQPVRRPVGAVIGRAERAVIGQAVIGAASS